MANPTPLAVASAKAGSLLECLSDDIVKKVMHDYLVKHVDPAPEYVNTPSGVMFRASGASVICNRGELTVEIGPFRHKEATLWKTEIFRLLARAAGLVYQQQVRHIVASHGTVVQEQKSSNGILLVMVEIGSGNSAVEVRVAIFPNGRIAVFGDENPGQPAREQIELLLELLKSKGLVRDISFTGKP